MARTTKTAAVSAVTFVIIDRAGNPVGAFASESAPLASCTYGRVVKEVGSRSVLKNPRRGTVVPAAGRNTEWLPTAALVGDSADVYHLVDVDVSEPVEEAEE